VSLSYPEPWPAPPPAPAPDHARTRGLGTVVAALGGGAVVAASGLLLGWIWAEVAPRVAVTKVENGFVYADAEPEQAVAADGWFAILGAAAGLVFAVLAWVLLRRYRGIGMLVAITIGSLVASALALWLGHKIGFGAFATARDAAAVGDRIDAPLGLRITNLEPDRWWIPRPTGVAAVQALITAFVYTCLAGFSSYGNLRGPDPVPPPGWPYAAPTLPPQPMPGQYAPAWSYPDREEPTTQLGPGRTGSSDSATGTART